MLQKSDSDDKNGSDKNDSDDKGNSDKSDSAQMIRPNTQKTKAAVLNRRRFIELVRVCSSSMFPDKKYYHNRCSCSLFPSWQYELTFSQKNQHQYTKHTERP